MGQSVTLVCPSNWSLDRFELPMRALATFVGGGQFARFDDEQLQVLHADDSGCVVLTPVAHHQLAVADYATNHDLDERFRDFVQTARLFDVRFDSLSEARWLLTKIADAAQAQGEEIWIDTDYGWSISGADFLSRVRTDPQWSWQSRP